MTGISICISGFVTWPVADVWLTTMPERSDFMLSFELLP